jgi:hypothetical protein
MDNDKLYMSTVYNETGERIGIKLYNDLETAHLHGKEQASIFEGSYKVWECTEIKKENK